MNSITKAIGIIFFGVLLTNVAICEEGLKLGGSEFGMKQSNGVTIPSPLWKPEYAKYDISIGTGDYSQGSSYGINLDNFLEGKRTFGFQSQNFTTRPCRDKNGVEQKELVMLSDSYDQINRAVACNDSLAKSKYDECSCAKYETCFKSVLGIDNYFGFKNTSMFKDLVQPSIGRIVANDYQEKMIKEILPRVEERKIMRKLADKLGVEIPKENECEGKNVGFSCDQEDFDKTLVNIQKGCNSSSKFTCYDLDSEKYTSIKVGKDENTVKFEKYLDVVASSKVDSKVTDFDQASSIIAELINQRKKFPLKNSPKTFLKNFKSKLELYGKMDKLDPIFNQIVQDDSKIEELYKEIVSKFKNSKSVTNESISSALKEVRAQKIKDYFSDYSCSSAKSLRKVCEVKAAIAEGKKSVIKSPIEESDMNRLFGDEDFKQGYDAYVESNFLRVIKTQNEYTAMVKGYRCYMLKYDFARAKVLKLNMCGDGFRQPVENRESAFAVEDTDSVLEETTRRSLSSSRNDVSTKKDDKMDIDLAPGVAANKIANDKNSMKDDIVIEEQKEQPITVPQNQPFTNPINSNISANNHSYVPFSDADEDSIDEKMKKKEKIPEKEEKSSIASYEERLRELTKKISATEESIDKMRAAKKEADSEAAKKENDEQLKQLQAQLAQVKSELAAAKAKKATVADSKATEVAAPLVARVPASTFSGTTVQVKDSSDDRVKKSSSDSSESSKEAAHSSSGTQSGVGANSNSSVVVGASSTAVKSSGLVLTKIDGLTTEAAVEAINQKISEGQGQPFFIEEGGFVKEIIPLLKDGKIVLDDKGKPMFEKIVKGKVADMKAKDAKRAPASVVNQADLRKIEEEKTRKEYERMQYLKLKELTGEAVK